MNKKWPWLEAAHGMRSQLLDLLSDANLTFHPGRQDMAFAALPLSPNRGNRVCLHQIFANLEARVAYCFTINLTWRSYFLWK